MATISRCLLHERDFNGFKDYLKANGWNIEKPKNCFEVVRARKKDEKTIILYQRIRTDHATIGWNMEHAYKLVRKYLSIKKGV